MKEKKEQKEKKGKQKDNLEPVQMSFEEAMRKIVSVPKHEVDEALNSREKKKPRGKQSIPKGL